MLVRAYWEIGTCAFPKAPIHEFEVTRAYLFPVEGFAPPALTLAGSLWKGDRE